MTLDREDIAAIAKAMLKELLPDRGEAPCQNLKPRDPVEWRVLVFQYHQTRSREDSIAVDQYMMTHTRPM